MYLFIIGYTLVLVFATGVSHTVVEISLKRLKGFGNK